MTAPTRPKTWLTRYGECSLTFTKKQRRKMSYKRASITLEFCMSTFEQYQPSAATVETDFEYGHDGKRMLLSDSERIRFLRMARDCVTQKLEHEIESQATIRANRHGVHMLMNL